MHRTHLWDPLHLPASLSVLMCTWPVLIIGVNPPMSKTLELAGLVQASLKRLGLDYVDLVFCHRPDPDTPIEETVRAMNHVIERGWVPGRSIAQAGTYTHSTHTGHSTQPSGEPQAWAQLPSIIGPLLLDLCSISRQSFLSALRAVDRPGAPDCCNQPFPAQQRYHSTESVQLE